MMQNELNLEFYFVMQLSINRLKLKIFQTTD